jgi:hypothetical protein
MALPLLLVSTPLIDEAIYLRQWAQRLVAESQELIRTAKGLRLRSQAVHARFLAAAARFRMRRTTSR